MEDVLEIDKIIEEQCKLSKITYIKLMNLLSNEELYDGLHPSSNGYEKICEKIISENY